ncbi:hypothetical protein [Streptomyces sp. NBC_01750]|uniref:hypothetical protein n=1 Tax=Streptomyces sp. NBC_01750 TaxID=2975928 RepID=UPI002DD898AE|nr:hypothetical protein [Streptomyces sp. NBC_01750]WSD38111.1 hypothetical protein OG966_40385 [Streptomyces sp. NBC_01750]
MAGDSSLASQVFTLAKDLAKVEKDVETLGERGGTVQAALAALDLGPAQLAIDHLEERTSGLQAEVQALAPLKEGLNALAKTVKQIRQDLEDRAAEPELQVWDWSFNGGMDKQQAGEAWETLIGWVRTVLQGQYGWVGPPADVFARSNPGSYGSVSANGPMTAARIPPCWYRHREAVIELSWLCQEWIKIYRTSYGTPSRAGDWHDRYAPNVKRRVIAALSKCCDDKGHVDDPWVTDPRQPGAPQAIDDDEQLSTWLNWDLGSRADAPAPGPVADR